MLKAPALVLALAGVLWGCGSQQGNPQSRAGSAAAPDVSFESVRAAAAGLSRRPYAAPEAALPRSLQSLDYTGYQAILYDHRQAAWSGVDVPFRLEFFHRGYLYTDRVAIHLVEDGVTRQPRFSPGLFLYRSGRPSGLDAIDGDLGFAGFRALQVTDPPGRTEEVAVFLGASYFRANTIGGVHGCSARGLAVDTAVASQPEEFPAFRRFWIVRPGPQAEVLTLYALLDSPSVTGAYRFDLRPGRETVVTVRAHLFFRKPVRALGLAPMSSMFFYGTDGDAGPAAVDPKRPAVHDSDGLLLRTASDEWVWRPLHNPRSELFSSFDAGPTPRGFGLMQRDRVAEHYRDTGARPEKRPSVWVEPAGPWPAGRIQLLELPSRGEGLDNIVAQYVLDRSPQAGEELAAGYRLGFSRHGEPRQACARTVQTMRRAQPDGSVTYAVDFAGEGLDRAEVTAWLRPHVTATGGELADVSLSDKGNDVRRVSFRLSPKSGATIVELRAAVLADGTAVSETWSDQWRP